MHHTNRKKMIVAGIVATSIVGGSVGLASALDSPSDPCDTVQVAGCEIPFGDREPTLVDLQRSVLEQEKEFETKVIDKTGWDADPTQNKEDFYDGSIRVPGGTPDTAGVFASNSLWAGMIGDEGVDVYGGAMREDIVDGRLPYGGVLVLRDFDATGLVANAKKTLVTAPDRSGELTITNADGAVLTLRGESGQQYRYDAADEGSKLKPIAP